jgi:ABC-2 type transport system ATP-binding protein
MTLSKVILEVKNLTKKFGSRVAVNDVSFKVYEGEIFGLIGPNGAGKTTILRMITGLAKPTSGEVFIDEISLVKHFEKAVTKIGAIIENPELYGYMTGMENLKFFASLYKKIKKEDINKIVRLVGMEKRINDRVKTYSLGMKQRIGIAQAMLHGPKILILDEPTNGLDPSGIKELRKLLIILARKSHITILVSSHILSEMELLCNTVGIIDKGELIEIKTLEEIRKGLQDDQKICIKVDYPNYAGKIIMHYYKVPVNVAGTTIIFNLEDRLIPQATALLIKSGLSIFGISTINKTLEEVFTEILNKKREDSSID